MENNFGNNRYKVKIALVVLIACSALTALIGWGIWLHNSSTQSVINVSEDVMKSLAQQDYGQVNAHIRCTECSKRIRRQWFAVFHRLGSLRGWKHQGVIIEFGINYYPLPVYLPKYWRVEYLAQFEKSNTTIVLEFVNEEGGCRLINIYEL